MVKNTQTIRRQKPNYLSVFDHFVELALKRVTGFIPMYHFYTPEKLKKSVVFWRFQGVEKWNNNVKYVNYKTWTALHKNRSLKVNYKCNKNKNSNDKAAADLIKSFTIFYFAKSCSKSRITTLDQRLLYGNKLISQIYEQLPINLWNQSVSAKRTLI